MTNAAPTIRPARRTLRRRLAVGAAAAVAVLALAACGDDGGEAAGDGAAPTAVQGAATAAGPDAAAAARDVGATVIDVRTPGEYDAGHVDGAELIDIQAPGFAEAVAGLDPDATYVVYCRSGNRSAQAATVMREQGLTVLDGGALTDMEAAGWPTA